MPDKTRRIRITRGLDIPIMGRPQQRIEDARAVSTVAVLGKDFPCIKPRLQVDTGDSIKLGQPLFVSKSSPSIRITSPGTGVISKIVRGPKRALRAIEIELQGDDCVDFGACRSADISALDADRVVQALLESGLWTALRTRPYNRIAEPTQPPFALFVTAIDTNPLCPDPGQIIDDASDAFHDGLLALTKLGDWPVYVCSAPASKLPLPNVPVIEPVEFDGPHPAGLPGTHIHFLAPVSARRSVWHIGYQDVIAIGRLFQTGRLDPQRIISLAGPVVMNPRLLRTRLGANTGELVQKEIDPGPARVISGSILGGHFAAGWGSYLGRYHHQISVLPDTEERQFLGWLSPGSRKFSATRVLLSSLFKRPAYWMTTSQNGSPRAMVPIGAYERVMPLDILPTQLLRALLVGDTDMAQGLGALELDEEDLSLCSFVCPSKYDYGPVLRKTLDQIQKEG